ncbi:uncharacterized protein LOC142528395 [Primulina tabacum]|uniref:uncharacterized protein LOC142528395 n=1 Tax=Primulina tabacum TaxID=48773 RepID=UPI003F5AA9BC
MLIGVTLDANNQILPLAFAIVDEETTDSWKWFLENLGKHVVRGENSVCLISDRHKGIVRAIEDLPYFQPSYGVHRFCLRHVCSNFNAKFKDVHLKDLCWAAGTQNQICKFEAIMEAIKQKNILAHRYLAGIAKEKWSLAHDSGRRRGVMTTNMSECLNSVLKGARRLPISAIVHMTLLRCVQYFIECVTRGGRMVQENQLWSDYACQKYEKWARKSSEHRVFKYDVREQTTSVAMVGGPSQWPTYAAKWHSLDPTTLVQPWYNLSEYLATYEGRFQPLADERYWDPPTFELRHNPVISAISNMPPRKKSKQVDSGDGQSSHDDFERRRFWDAVAAQNYTKLQEKNMQRERRMDQSVQGCDTLNLAQHLHWAEFVKPPPDAVMSVVLEFYANLMVRHEDYHVRVRGQMVAFDSRTINSLYFMPD